MRQLKTREEIKETYKYCIEKTFMTKKQAVKYVIENFLNANSTAATEAYTEYYREDLDKILFDIGLPFCVPDADPWYALEILVEYFGEH